MCGRFTLRTTGEEVARQFQLDLFEELRPRYNVAPTQEVASVRQRGAGEGRELAMLRWGLVPSWAKDLAIGNRMINARAETAAEKPSYRSAFKKRRCLVLADGYYEWKKTAEGKQPMHMHRADDGVFGFAGLWERWSKGDGPVESCTIITTAATGGLAEVHDRMPVIVKAENYDAWLDPEFVAVEELQRILGDGDEGELVATEVSTLVNNPRNEDPKCVEAVG